MVYSDQVEDTRSSLGHMPEGRWAFDEAVASVFTDMLTRSIPQYEVMRKSVFDLGMTVVRPGTAIVDLGCSRGDGLAPFVSALGDRNHYLGIDVSQPMLAAARQRFSAEIAGSFVSIRDFDLRNGYPQAPASLTLCVLSLQFIPIEHRQRVLLDAYTNTLPGGAFILVEKVLGNTASINQRMVELYHARKQEMGYSVQEIERKKLSLEGVLVPVTAQWNEELLLTAGFREVDCFWRWMNFGAWVAIR